MFIKLPETGYHFSNDNIKKIEEHYSSNYLGYWAIKDKTGNWSETPLDVFYNPNPDVNKGHSHYFGLFKRQDGSVMITDASSAFSEPIVGVLTEDGEVLVSRYRHDFSGKGEGAAEVFIDGGRDYTRIGGNNVETVEVVVEDGSFMFRKNGEASENNR